jgi:hypothetical protein
LSFLRDARPVAVAIVCSETQFTHLDHAVFACADFGGDADGDGHHPVGCGDLYRAIS